MSIKAEIIADSLNPTGVRLTSFVLEFPRWILAEVNTHRVLSRNVASSRAIKIERMIEMVKENPAMPEFWGKNQAGMQSLEELQGEERERAKDEWLRARDRAVESAEALMGAGMHKQYVNRTIENFMYVRAIVSATQWENFFALRAHRDSQPEFSKLAYLMLELYNSSAPKQLVAGAWHIPFGDRFDDEQLATLGSDSLGREDLKKKVAVARCARVSYYNFEGKDDYRADLNLCDKLFGSVPRHLSPTEHVAMAEDHGDFIGNFRGFRQYRKFFLDENLTDGRVKNGSLYEE